MGLLSDYSDLIGGAPGLLAAPPIQLNTSLADMQGLLAANPAPGPSAQYPLASAQPSAPPSMQMAPTPPPGSSGSAQNPYGGAGRANPPPAAAAPQVGLFAPPQGGVGGLLKTVGNGLLNAVELPFNYINAIGSNLAAEPERIAYERARMQFALKNGLLNQQVMSAALNGGLFGDSQPQQVQASAAPDLPPAAISPLPPLQGHGVAPTPVGPITAPRVGGGTVTLGAPAASGLSPSPASGPVYGGGMDLRNPRTQRMIAALELVGNPAGAQLATLGASLLPKFSAVRPGGGVMNEQTGQVTGFVPGENGTVNAPDGRGGFVNQAVPGAATNNAAYQGAAAGARAAGEAIGKLPYAGALSYADAAGKGAAEDPRTFVTVDLSDGSKWTGPRSVAMQRFGVAGTPVAGGGPVSGGPPRGAPLKGGGVVGGAPAFDGPVFGQSQTPAAAAFAGDQAKDLSGVISADQGGRQAAQQARDDGLRALTIASQTPFNPAKPAAYEAERIGSILGIHPRDLDNVAAYKQLATGQLFKGAKALLPSRYTEREVSMLTGMFGSIKDPNSAAQIAAATQAALSNKALARAQYADTYDPNSSGVSRQAYEAGWARTPAGKASIFADPVWQQFKINGKPAVVPYTVKGVPWLAVTPGLAGPGKRPTLIPAQY